MYVVPATNQGEGFKFLFLHMVVRYKLQIHDVEAHLQQDDTARNILSGDLVFVQVNVFLGYQGRVSTVDEVILEDEVEDAAEMPQLYLLLVDKADVPGYVGVD